MSGKHSRSIMASKRARAANKRSKKLVQLELLQQQQAHAGAVVAKCPSSSSSSSSSSPTKQRKPEATSVVTTTMHHHQQQQQYPSKAASSMSSASLEFEVDLSNQRHSNSKTDDEKTDVDETDDDSILNEMVMVSRPPPVLHFCTHFIPKSMWTLKESASQLSHASTEMAPPQSRTTTTTTTTTTLSNLHPSRMPHTNTYHAKPISIHHPPHHHNGTFSVRIPSFHCDTNDGHVTYSVVIETPDHAWTITKRYSEFVALAQALHVREGIVWDSLPPKTWFRLTQDAALDDRRERLESACFDLLQRDDAIAMLPVVRTFFQLDEFAMSVVVSAEYYPISMAPTDHGKKDADNDDDLN